MEQDLKKHSHWIHQRAKSVVHTQKQLTYKVWALAKTLDADRMGSEEGGGPQTGVPHKHELRLPVHRWAGSREGETAKQAGTP